jgi:hypothetical protein
MPTPKRHRPSNDRHPPPLGKRRLRAPVGVREIMEVEAVSMSGDLCRYCSVRRFYYVVRPVRYLSLAAALAQARVPVGRRPGRSA